MSNDAKPLGRPHARPAVRALAACGLLIAAVAARAETPTARSAAPAKAVQAFDTLFQGPHTGFRAVHSKGVLCEGIFEPTAVAREISVAPHLSAPATPVLVRLSNFSGKPDAADNDPLASPRGIAIKFELPDGGDTDIVAHSYNGFPAGTPEEFVLFLQALVSPDATAVPTFVADHPAARAFLDAAKPPPTSYATESFFGVNAFAFTNAAGETLYGRYRIVPLAGPSHLTAQDAARQPPDYLSRDLAARLASGVVRYRLDLQIADAGDNTADGSVPWPPSRRVVALGTLTLKRLVPDSSAIQRDILFTPLNLVAGILPSGDPMLDARSRAYRISHLRRSGEASAAGEVRP